MAPRLALLTDAQLMRQAARSRIIMALTGGTSQADASGESSSGASDSGSDYESDTHSILPSFSENYPVQPEGQPISATDSHLALP